MWSISATQGWEVEKGIYTYVAASEFDILLKRPQELERISSSIMSPIRLASPSRGDGWASSPETKQVYAIASIPADGIGPEVVEAAIVVLKAIAKKRGTFQLDFTNFDWSSETYKRTGKYVPTNHLDILRKFDAILSVRFSSHASSS